MNAIIRDVYVTQKKVYEKIDVTSGTDMIPFVFYVRDFEIPDGSTAVAYAAGPGGSNPVKLVCGVGGNTVTFTPVIGFFRPGINILQIRIVHAEKTLVTFGMIVCCEYSIDFGDEVEEQDSLITQLLSRYAQLGIFAIDYVKGDQLDMSDLPIQSNCVVIMPKGTYNVTGVELHDVENVTFYMNGSILNLIDFFIKVFDSRNVHIMGGVIDGKNRVVKSVFFQDTPESTVEKVIFRNNGNRECEGTTMLDLYGDCTGFAVRNCTFENCVAGVSGDGRFINSFGIFVNRLGSKHTYSKTGLIENCYFDQIAGIDNDTIKADGDAIFVQSIPYSDDGTVVYPESKIVIRGCYFNNCKKRGVKLASLGTVVENCVFDGEYWFACIESQYGHSKIRNCRMYNGSDYTGSITSACVIGDGGVTIEDCWMSAPYSQTYHPGIRFNSRQSGSLVTGTWDPIEIKRCTFDGVNRAVYAIDNSSSPSPDALEGLVIEDCYIKNLGAEHAFEIYGSRFSEIGVLKFLDYRFEDGKDRQEIKEKHPQFSYPVETDTTMNVTMCYENHSSYWKNEVQSPYADLPQSIHSKIIHEGNIGGVIYKEYNAYSSLIVGTRNPEDISATLGKQCLYNSRVGDRYINKSVGTLFLCTGAGTDTTIGTWTPCGGIQTELQSGDEVSY